MFWVPAWNSPRLIIGRPAIVVKYLFQFIGCRIIGTIDTVEDVVALRSCTEQREVQSFPTGG